MVYHNQLLDRHLGHRGKHAADWNFCLLYLNFLLRNILANLLTTNCVSMTLYLSHLSIFEDLQLKGILQTNIIIVFEFYKTINPGGTCLGQLMCIARALHWIIPSTDSRYAICINGLLTWVTTFNNVNLNRFLLEWKALVLSACNWINQNSFINNQLNDT